MYRHVEALSAALEAGCPSRALAHRLGLAAALDWRALAHRLGLAAALDWCARQHAPARTLLLHLKVLTHYMYRHVEALSAALEAIAHRLGLAAALDWCARQHAPARTLLLHLKVLTHYMYRHVEALSAALEALAHRLGLAAALDWCARQHAPARTLLLHLKVLTHYMYRHVEALSAALEAGGAWRALAHRLGLAAALDWCARQHAPARTLLLHLKVLTHYMYRHVEALSAALEAGGAWRALAHRLGLAAALDWCARQHAPARTLLLHLKVLTHYMYRHVEALSAALEAIAHRLGLAAALDWCARQHAPARTLLLHLKVLTHYMYRHVEALSAALEALAHRLGLAAALDWCARQHTPARTLLLHLKHAPARTLLLHLKVLTHYMYRHVEALSAALEALAHRLGLAAALDWRSRTASASPPRSTGARDSTHAPARALLLHLKVLTHYMYRHVEALSAALEALAHHPRARAHALLLHLKVLTHYMYRHVEALSAALEAGGAWRALAHRLGLAAALDWCARQHAPARTLLLHLKECRNDISSKKLAVILEDMGELEAASIIRRHIE
ncbi:uncharacterized protein LOC119189956 [Manduca sexta]|uniref:uncharacterized protein LOC119189956 n=1 Tax=Manduca sexta TaxID=7130 RepID=UPI00188F0AC0|nr:uncharacterized protein LOC119189956 [Manduca sexta]